MFFVGVFANEANRQLTGRSVTQPGGLYDESQVAAPGPGSNSQTIQG